MPLMMMMLSVTYQPKPLPQIKLPLILFSPARKWNYFSANETARKWDNAESTAHQERNVFCAKALS
jgi:hypothetical protein